MSYLIDPIGKVLLLEAVVLVEWFAVSVFDLEVRVRFILPSKIVALGRSTLRKRMEEKITLAKLL